MAVASSIASTGSNGLDDILVGGLPRDRVYLLQGDPGVGKTTISLQFLRAGIDAGERCLYITLSETESEINAVARSHGWTLDGIDLVELSALEQTGTLETENTLFEPSEVELHETTRVLLSHVERCKPDRVVLDSLKAISVLKKRTGLHETTIREIRLGQGGVHVGEPLTRFHGVLTGVPSVVDRDDASGAS